ncbi:MAG: T9SS type A sorting domain-containing protein [Bacteroidales bacterium]|nr:T9SS type A sorting domain-containing protein [Bacteroidales bacterium]
MNLKQILILSVIYIISVNTSFSQANAGVDQEVCTDATTLAADPPLSGYTGEWTVISGACTINNKTLYNTTVSSLLQNFNELRWTITNGTNTYTDEVIITNNYPTQALTASDEEICNNSYTLNANIYGSGESGIWTVESGSGTLLTPTINTSDVTGLASGNNTFRWTINKGICSSFDEIIITNHTVTANAGTNETICEDYTSLSANNPSPGAGTWSVVASDGSPVFGNINDFNTTISGLGPNTNSLQWTVTYGICIAYDNVIITSNKPTVALAGTYQIICDNNTFLAGNNPVQGTGKWSIVSGTATFIDISNYNTQVTGISNFSNIYKWTINKNGCISEDNVEIYYDYFVADAGTDDVTCTDSYNLNANPPAPGTGEWRVTGGNGTFVDATLNNTVVNNLLAGENTFEWKITHGACIQTSYVIITRNTASTADAGSDIETCNGTTTLSALSPSVGTGYWSLISGTGIFVNSLQNNTDVTNVGLNSNTYRWTVTNLGCSNFDDVTVTNNYVYSYAGVDQIICGTNSVLSGNQPQTGETGEWLLLAGTSIISNLTLYNSVVNNLNSGLNKYRWTITKGTCNAFDEIDITNNQYIANADISGPSDICSDSSAILGNSPPTGGTAYWTVETGTGIIDNSVDQSTFVRNLSLGANIIRWTIVKDGCSDFDEITINRNTVFADAGVDQIICDNFTSLSAVPAGSGLSGVWTVGGGSGNLADPSLANTQVTGLTSGLNTFIWTISGNGCSADDIVEITNNMFFTSTSSNQEICVSYTTISATDPLPGTGYWELISGSGVFGNVSNYNTTVSNISNNSVNIYRWNATLNGCNASDDIQVKNNFVPADAGSNITVCTNYAVLSAVTPDAGTGLWSVQSGAGLFADENSASTLVTSINLNENIYRWTVTNIVCSDYSDVSVTNNNVVSSAGGDQELCYDYTQLSAEQPPVGGTGNWELISGFANINNTTLFNTNVTNLQSGISVFKWTVFNNGCSSGAGDEVSINNKSFTAYAGEDQALEPFVTSTNLAAVLPENATGEWMLVGGGGTVSTISDPSTAVTNMPTGINTFMWTVNKNLCTSYDYVEITVINFTVNAGINRTICTDSVQLNAADYTGATQSWSVVQGTGNFDNPNLYNTWVRNCSMGANIYRWTVTQSGATTYNDIIVTQIFAYAGEDQLVCTNNITLEGNIPGNGYSGLWSVVSGTGNIISPTFYNTEVQNIDFLNNIFQWSVISPECIISDYVYVYNDMVTADAGTDQEIETLDTYLNAVMPFNTNTELWSVISGSGTFTDDTDPGTYVSGLSEGENIFRWTVSNDNCSDFDDVTVRYIYNNGGGTYINDINDNFRIYPNPNSGKFNIEKNDNTAFNIEISDLYGKLIYFEENISENNKTINLLNVPAGIYFLKITSGKSKRTIKIVKR